MDTRGRPALGPRRTGSHSGPHGYRPGYAKGARPSGGAWRPTRMRAIAKGWERPQRLREVERGREAERLEEAAIRAAKGCDL